MCQMHDDATYQQQEEAQDDHWPRGYNNLPTRERMRQSRQCTNTLINRQCKCKSGFQNKRCWLAFESLCSDSVAVVQINMKHYPPPSGHGAGCQDRKPEAGGMLSWDQQRGYPPIALLSWFTNFYCWTYLFGEQTLCFSDVSLWKMFLIWHSDPQIWRYCGH